MKLTDILSPDAVVCDVKAASKKQLLELLSALASDKTGIDERIIMDALVERERLGTTGIGHGVALPHTRLAPLDRIFCAFVRTTPVDFDSVDNKPIDLVFLLLVPEEAGADHLKALARLSRLLRDETVATQMRQAPDATTVYDLIQKNDRED